MTTKCRPLLFVRNLKDNMLEHYQILTREEEIAAYARGDKDALAKSQIRFIYQAARKVVRFVGRPDLLDEAVAIGMLHLASRIKSYDCRGRLITYVSNGLRQAIFAGLQICLNTGGVRKCVRSANEWRPTKLKCKSAGPMPIEGKQQKMAIVDKDEIDFLMGLSPSTDRNKDMVRLRYTGLTMEEVGKRFGVTRQRVEHVERIVIGEIRELAMGRSI